MEHGAELRAVDLGRSHVMEPQDLWWNAIGKRYGDHTPRVIDEHLGKKGTFFYTGRQVLKIGQTDHEAQKIGFQKRATCRRSARVPEAGRCHRRDPQRHVHAADHAGPPPRRESGLRSVFNDWLAEFCSHDPERLGRRGHDSDGRHRLGVRGARSGREARPQGDHHQPDSTRGQPALPGPGVRSVLGPAQELQFPVTLHIITGRVPDPLHLHTKEEQGQCASLQIALMYEIMGVLANEFIFGRILDRFPRLKLVCSEFEISWIPNFMWRLDQMQEDFGYRRRPAEARPEGERLHAPSASGTASSTIPSRPNRCSASGPTG